MKITRDVPKSITKSLIPPHRHMISEQYLTPWSGEVELVKSFCAKGDGATGYINVANLKSLGTRDYDLTCYAAFDELPQVAGICGSHRFGIYSKAGIAINGGYLEAHFGNASVEFKVRVDTATLGITVNTIHKYRVFADRSDELHLYVDDTEVGAGIDISSIAADDITLTYDFRICANIINEFNGKVWNVELKFDDVVMGNWPLQGSAYDISGNDNHGVVSATGLDLYERQDSFHYNITYGFDLWFRTGGTIGTESDYVWVPHVDGVGVVDAVAGFTLQSSHPKVAFKNDNPLWHNGAETALRFPAGSLMDKSVVADWLVAIQATLGYDGANPTDWYCNSAVPTLQEVTPYFLSTYWDDASNKIGVATTPNEYTYDAKGTPITGDITEELVTQDLAVTKSQSLIIYSQAMIVRQLDKFGRYVKRLVGI